MRLLSPILILLFTLQLKGNNTETKHSVLFPDEYVFYSASDVDIGNLNSSSVVFSRYLNSDDEFEFIITVYHSSIAGHITKDYLRAVISGYDITYGRGVIGIFSEDIDLDKDKELLVIIEDGCRTYYSDGGGYAGIRPIYSTKVFDIISDNRSIVLKEYKAIGSLLTVNPPLVAGSVREESLIINDTDVLYEKLGVTNNIEAIRKRIEYLKQEGVLL